MNQLTLKERHELRKIEEMREVLKEAADKQTVETIKKTLEALKSKIGVFDKIPALKNAYEAGLNQTLQIFNNVMKDGYKPKDRGFFGRLKDFFWESEEEANLKSVIEFTEKVKIMFDLVKNIVGSIKDADDNSTVREILERAPSGSVDKKDEENPESETEKTRKEVESLISEFESADESKKKNILQKLNLSKNTIKERVQNYKDIVSKSTSTSQKQMYEKSIKDLETILNHLDEKAPDSEDDKKTSYTEEEVRELLNRRNSGIKPKDRPVFEKLVSPTGDTTIDGLREQILELMFQRSDEKVPARKGQITNKINGLMKQFGSKLESMSLKSESVDGSKIKESALKTINDTISKVSSINEDLNQEDFIKELEKIPGFKNSKGNILLTINPFS